MRTDLAPMEVDTPAIDGLPIGPRRVFSAGGAGDDMAAIIVMVLPGGRSGRRRARAVAMSAKVVLGLVLVGHDLIFRCSGNHHVSVVAWPNAWLPKLSGSGTAQPPACRAQKFSGRIAHRKHGIEPRTALSTHAALAEKFCDP
ncbi:MAG: hypothetical protein AAF498_00170 [Pseudomonadota bacterium]